MRKIQKNPAKVLFQRWLKYLRFAVEQAPTLSCKQRSRAARTARNLESCLKFDAAAGKVLRISLEKLAMLEAGKPCITASQPLSFTLCSPCLVEERWDTPVAGSCCQASGAQWRNSVRTGLPCTVKATVILSTLSSASLR